IRIKKAINAANPLAPTPAEEADSPTGPVLAVGAAITWTYRVWTTGSTPLYIVTLTDDNGTPNAAGDDFVPVYVSCDNNPTGMLDPGEVWLSKAPGLPTPGQYTNTGTVGAGPTPQTAPLFSADTPNSPGSPGIRIKKAVNAVDPLHPTVAED